MAESQGVTVVCEQLGLGSETNLNSTVQKVCKAAIVWFLELAGLVCSLLALLTSGTLKQLLPRIFPHTGMNVFVRRDIGIPVYMGSKSPATAPSSTPAW